MANRTQIQTALQKPYDRLLFGKEVLSPVFGSCFTLSTSAVPASVQPNKSEQAVIQSVGIYGNINLEDGTEITCYEITLQSTVRIDHSKVAIQRYVRKLLTAGQIALVNFIAPQNKKVWRLTLVAKDSELTEQGIKEKTTHAKRYTYLLGPSETCKTAAERFETLSTERQITFQALVNAFSVEKLSKAFFDEYTLHYQKFCDYLQESNFRKSVFKISISTNATKEEKEKACKPIRDFVKKLLGRIVFLYFVQKKGWLGASDTHYKDGLNDFIKKLFKQSGGNDTFYPNWLTVLFFETLNKERNNDDFKMPDGKKVKVPFLNGGLFDKEDYDEAILPIRAKLFHHPDFEDAILTEKNWSNARGFLDFLDAFNFTVHEDSPDDHTVAVDPEMLGHIFEKLLEDNKDKSAFYTPKEIVHYMCQESLTEYLTKHLSKEYTVYKEIGNAQVELFGNETKTGQLKMVEQLGDKSLNRDDVAYIVKHKDISHLTKAQLKKIDSLLDTVKICDPAIGSGAFPMGLLQEIHAIKEVIAYELKQPWKPADVKENIIQNSVYGVDIEKGAVDIARLRFWLSLVVDEEKPRALPNLDYKIVVGDSLVSKFEGEIIEIDWDRKSSVGKADTFVQNIQRLLKEIAEKQKKFFKPDNKDKKKLQAEIRNLKLELLINQLSFNKEKFLANNVEKGGFAPTASDLRFNEELKQKNNDFDRHIVKLQRLKQNKEEPFEHFDWKLDFPEVLNPYLVNGNTGFDILIGNPPYLNMEKFGAKSEYVNYIKTAYNEIWMDKSDLLFYFIKKAVDLSKNEGVIQYIISNAFLFSEKAKKLRNYLLDKAPIQCIINFEKYRVFDSAMISTAIVRFSKNSNREDTLVYSPDRESLVVDKSLLFKNIKYFNVRFEKDKVFALNTKEFESIHQLIDFETEPLGELLKVGSGMQTAANDVFCNEDIRKILKSRNCLRKRLNGKAISKYFIDDNLLEDILYVEEYENFNDLPTDVQNYLIANKKTLSSRADKMRRKTSRWWNFSFPMHKDYYHLDKIWTSYRNSNNKFAFDSSKKLIGLTDTTAIFNSNPTKVLIKYVLGILNSKLIDFRYKSIGKQTGGGLFEYFENGISKIPIKVMPIINQATLEKFVNYIIYLRQQQLITVNDQLMPIYFEQIIDGMVYELYFPELIKKHKREIIQHLGELPEFTDKMNDEQKMKVCKTVFDRLNEREHPVRVNLFYMNSIPEIAIIEGKNENN